MRTLILIPAYNEADSLPTVLEEFRTCAPGMDVLVVDDGSEDSTPSLLAERGARRLHLPVRQGVGTAVRTGLRYAKSCGYDAVIRFDGDGQHPAGFLDALVAPLMNGTADVAIGSRYALHPRPRATTSRATRWS